MGTGDAAMSSCRSSQSRQQAAGVDMPSVRLEPLARPPQPASGHVEPLTNSKPDAAATRLVHHLHVSVGGLLVDDRHAAASRAELLEPIEQAAVVGSVASQRDEHDAVDSQRLVQRLHGLDGSRLESIATRRDVLVLTFVTDDVPVDVGCAGWHVERYRGRRAREPHRRRSLREGATQTPAATAPLKASRRVNNIWKLLVD